MIMFKKSMLAASLLLPTSILAATTAITNVTLYTGTEQGKLNNATVVFEDGKITQINPNVVKADEVIDGKNQLVTAGFIAPLTQLGLVEVGAVATSNDDEVEKEDLMFDPSYGFNPYSSLLPFARKGGLTSTVIAPGSYSKTELGLGFNALLNGELDSITATKTAAIMRFGGKSKESRAKAFNDLIEKLEKYSKTEKAEEGKEKDNDPVKALYTQLLGKEIPLVVYASRASDLVNLANLQAKYQFNLVLVGAQDSRIIADKLAKPGITVLMQVMDNLPTSFDSLHATLETAGLLEKAGVKVGFYLSDSHLVYNLRLDAGNAVSYGMSYDAALAGLTSTIANAFNIEAGVIAPGKRADLVMWSGDPLEVSTKVTGVWINGEAVDTTARPDKLRDRYVSDAKVRRGYIKP